MPQNTLTIPRGTWTLLTLSDVAAARVYLVSGGSVEIQATVGAVPPTDRLGAIPLRNQMDGFDAGKTLAELFPGVTGANRLYAIAGEAEAILTVSY